MVSRQGDRKTKVQFESTIIGTGCWKINKKITQRAFRWHEHRSHFFRKMTHHGHVRAVEISGNSWSRAQDQELNFREQINILSGQLSSLESVNRSSGVAISSPSAPRKSRVAVSSRIEKKIGNMRFSRWRSFLDCFLSVSSEKLAWSWARVKIAKRWPRNNHTAQQWSIDNLKSDSCHIINFLSINSEVVN